MDIISIVLGLVVIAVIALYFDVRRSKKTLLEEKDSAQFELRAAQNKSIELAIKEEGAIAQINNMQRVLSEKESQILILTDERATAINEVKLLKSQSIEEKRRVQEMQENFRNEFKSLANDILEQKSKQFKETNMESMEHILKPFKENIREFKSRVEQIHTEENQQRGALKSELKNLMELNRKITEETTGLTNALKGNSKVQGDWGEMILETILNSSNLINGIHYTTQQSFTDEDGARFRPDVVLNLPDDKQIVIDSKASLTAFVEYANADDVAERSSAMSRHIVSIRKHIDELGGKAYHELNLKNSPYFVIMFIPNEPAFLAAIQSDPSIWSYAYNKKVMISSPTNLFALLKLVDDLWKRDNQSKNAIEIARQGGNLYDKLMLLLNTMSEIGRNLENTTKSYDKAISQIKSGSGNLVARSESIRKLGVKTSKILSTQFENYDQEENLLLNTEEQSENGVLDQSGVNTQISLDVTSL